MPKGRPRERTGQGPIGRFAPESELAQERQGCESYAMYAEVSLSSVARTPRLMSYDRLSTGSTTYSRRVSQIYERSYAQVARTQHYGGPLVPPRILFYFCFRNFLNFPSTTVI